MSRVALVTGSSSGIGLATAVALARSGDTVLATMRDPSRDAVLRDAVRAAGVDVEVVRLDVTDQQSVDACVEDALTEHGRIDVLVNNAGVLHAGTLEELSIEDLQAALDVNFLGAARMMKAVLPSMRAQGSGRLISVSSIAGAFGQPFNDAYCAAKFALEGLSESLHPVAAAFGVRVSLVEAGPVTGAFREHGSGSDARSSDGPFAELWQRFLAISDGGYERAQTPDDIAEVIVSVAAAERPYLRYQTSRLVDRLVGMKLADLSGEAVTSFTARWLAPPTGGAA